MPSEETTPIGGIDLGEAQSQSRLLLQQMLSGEGAFAPVDIDAITATGTETGAQIAAAGETAAADAVSANLDRFFGGELSDQILDQTLDVASAAHDFMQNAIIETADSFLGEGGLARLISGAQGAYEDVTDTVNAFMPSMVETIGSMLRGEIPTDVSEMVFQRAGENVLARFGRTEGPMSEGLVARDVAESSLNTIARGMEMAGQAVGIAGSPIAAAGQVGNLIRQFLAPAQDVAAMYGAGMNMASRLGGLNPEGARTGAANAYGAGLNLAANIAGRNSELAVNSSVSAMNYLVDVQAAELSYRGALEGAAATRDAGQMKADAILKAAQSAVSGIGAGGGFSRGSNAPGAWGAWDTSASDASWDARMAAKKAETDMYRERADAAAAARAARTSPAPSIFGPAKKQT